MPDYLDLIIRFGLNLASVVLLLFVFYYPRYSNKETTIAASLFNIFAFAVLSILSSVQFSVAAGFGLFAILALFTLRSEQIDKSDIAYFFGSISLAVITSVQGTQIEFVILMLVIVLLAVYIIDHPRILRTASQMKVTLDFIPEQAVSNPDVLKEELSKRLGAKIISVKILSIDYVTEIVRTEVGFRVED